MSDEKEPKNSTVGYRKPPKQAQFRKGVSGNPRGRPKRTGAIPLSLEGAMEEVVTVRQNGEARKLPRKEVQLRRMLKQVVEKQNLKAIAYLMGQFEKHGVLAADAPVTNFVIVIPYTVPFKLGCMVLDRYGPPPWSRHQIASLKPAYLAQRDERQRIYDEEMGYLYEDTY
jgi:hypothetical protein